MTNETPAQVAPPEPQAGDGQQNEQEQPKTPLAPEDMAAALERTRREAADYRRKLRENEARLAAAEKAQAAEAERQAAEQGRFQELYEAEKARAAQAAERLAQLERDVMRKDAAQAAGIPQLWQRLQGATAEELAEDALALAAMMQPAQPANGQTPRQPTQPTPQPQGRRELTAEERRAKATRTI